MALTAATIFETRTTGDDTQGGCFDSTIAGAGTDLSQQDSAALSLTDVVTNGTTTVTSATGGFTAAMVGNGFNIAGTIYQITARASLTSVTVDRTATTASGQTGKVGGALASPGKAAGAIVAGNTVYVKSGTYLIGTGTASTSGNRVSLTVGASATAALRFIGYGSARGDQGAKPVLQLSADLGSGNHLFNGGGQVGVLLDNLDFNGASVSTTANGGLVSSGGNGFRVARCRFRGWKSGPAINLNSQPLIHDCEFTACASTVNTGKGTFARCYFHDNTANVDGGTSNVNYRWCVFAGNTGALTDAAVSSASDHNFHHCVFYNNGRHGIFLGGIVNALIEGCIFWGNGGYGVTSANSMQNARIAGCAGGSNASGNLDTNATAMVEGGSFIVLTANPFTNAAGGDFSLNSVAGGGAACRAAGIGSFSLAGLSTTVGYPDIGAAQSQAGGLRRVTMTGGITG